MFEFLILAPNICATYFLMKEDAFKSNLLYFIGYILMIYYNLKINDPLQIFYFSLLWIMTVAGILHHVKNSKTVNTCNV